MLNLSLNPESNTEIHIEEVETKQFFLFFGRAVVNYSDTLTWYWLITCCCIVTNYSLGRGNDTSTWAEVWRHCWPPTRPLFPAVIGRQGTLKADLRGKVLSQFSQRLLIPTRCSTHENSTVRREEKRREGPRGFFFFFVSFDRHFPTAQLPCFKLCSQSIAPTQEIKRTCTRRETQKTD